MKDNVEIAAVEADIVDKRCNKTNNGRSADEVTSAERSVNTIKKKSDENLSDIKMGSDPHKEERLLESKSAVTGQANIPVSKYTNKHVTFGDPLVTVFSTYSSSEYNRLSHSSDPIYPFGRYEIEKRTDDRCLFDVTLFKENIDTSLGFSVMAIAVDAADKGKRGGGIERLGIFVSSIASGGLSDRDGRIEVADQILSVNGLSFVGVTQEFAINTLKTGIGALRFIFGRELDETKSDVLNIIKNSRKIHDLYNEDEQNTKCRTINHSTTFSVFEQFKRRKEKDTIIESLGKEVFKTSIMKEAPQGDTDNHDLKISKLEKDVKYLRQQIACLTKSMKEQNCELEKRVTGQENRYKDLQNRVKSLEKIQAKNNKEKIARLEAAKAKKEALSHSPIPRLSTFLSLLLSAMKTQRELMRLVSKTNDSTSDSKETAENLQERNPNDSGKDIH